MAELDFAEAIEALEGVEGGLFAEMEGASSLEEAETKIGEWKTSDAAKSFDQFKSNFFEKFTDITKGEDGGWDIKNPETGDEFNTKELKEKMTGEYGENLKAPDYKGAFEKLGVSESSFDNEGFKQFSERNQEAFENSKTAKDCEGVNKSTKTGSDISNNVGGEPSGDNIAQDFEEKGQKTGKWRKFTDTMEKIKNGSLKVGKWITYTALVGGVAYGLEELHRDIKDHQNAMNGCWYIKTADGSKCKVWPLSCNKDSRITESGYRKCTMCTDIKRCINDLAFNPSIADAYPKSSECFSGKCGGGSTTTCTKNDDCTSNDADKPPFPGDYTDGKDPSSTCANSTNCATFTNCKDEGDCSEFCDVSKFDLPVGYTLKCVSVDFWGASDDFLGGGLDTGGDILKKILKILMYVVIIIIVLFVIFFIGKFLWSLSKNKDKK